VINFIYLYAVASCLSIAATNGILGIFTLHYLVLSFKKKKWQSPPIDFHLFSAIYTWKGITMIANGAILEIYKVREIWDKLPYWVVSQIKISKSDILKMLHILFATNSLLVVYALCQKHLGFPVFVQPILAGARMIGYFGNPLHYAGYLSIVLIVCFAVSKVHKHFLFYFLFLATGLGFSGSRGYYIASIFSCLVISFFKSRKSLYKSIAIAPLFIFALNYISPAMLTRMHEIGNGNEGHIRFNLWSAGWNIFKDNIFFGVGYEQLSSGYLSPLLKKGLIVNASHAHNLYIEELAEGGILGGILITVTMIYFVWKYYRYSKQISDPFVSAFSLGISSSFLALMIGGVTEYNFGTAVVWLLITFLMGVLESYGKSIELKTYSSLQEFTR